MKTYEFYQSLYYREQTIRNQHEQKFPFILTLTSFAIILEKYLMDGWDFINYRLYGLITLFLFILFFLLEIILIFKSFMSFKFKYCDFPIDQIRSSIYEYMIENDIHLKISNENFREATSDKRVLSYTECMLSRTYEHCATIYYRENIRRRKRLHYLNIMYLINLIVIVFVFLLNLFLKGGI